jgi:hypothetical protein
MELEGLLQHLQVATTYPYPEKDQLLYFDVHVTVHRDKFLIIIRTRLY